MTKAEQKLHTDADKLRRLLADAEAVVSGLRARLAKLDAKITGEPPPESGLEMLWKAALPMAKSRSSKHQCRQEWARIPLAERPPVARVIDALYRWNRSPEWKKDSNSFVPGLHLWIKRRQWENVPETTAPAPAPSRYRSIPKAVPVTAPEDAATPEEIASILSLTQRQKLMNS
jgi:hypothetical protein